LQNPLNENPTSARQQQSKHLIDDKHPYPPEDFFFPQHPNHVNQQQNQKNSHHFSVNQKRRQFNVDNETWRRRQNEEQQHHNLEDVSYETSIDKSISKEYSKYHII
jgi:hypothetical protein